jgi:hypothetical protein
MIELLIKLLIIVLGFAAVIVFGGITWMITAEIPEQYRINGIPGATFSTGGAIAMGIFTVLVCILDIIYLFGGEIYVF